MRRLTRRLALPIFGVLWLTVLLFFWVTKWKLEVPPGPEVQTPKVRGLAVCPARGSGLLEGARPALGSRALGEPGRGSECCDQVAGVRCGHLRGFPGPAACGSGSGCGWWACALTGRAGRPTWALREGPAAEGRCGRATLVLAVGGRRQRVTGWPGGCPEWFPQPPGPRRRTQKSGYAALVSVAGEHPAASWRCCPCPPELTAVLQPLSPTGS